MVVRVVESLPDVVLGIHVMLVGVVAQVDVGKHILQLGVVVERNGREWVEVVGVDGLGLSHVVVLLLLDGILLTLGVRLIGTEVNSEGRWVGESVDTPAHTANGTHSV